MPKAKRISPWFQNITYRPLDPSTPATKDDEKTTPKPPPATYTSKGDAEAYVDQGIAYWEAGQYERASKACNEAIRLDPVYAVAYNVRGIAYVELGIANLDPGQFKPALADFNKAIKDFDEAIRIDPEYADAYFERGYTYHHDTLNPFNKDKAIRDYTEAIRIDPEYADAYFERGNAYSGLNYLQALSDYDEALRLDPKNSDYYYRREKLIKQAIWGR